MSKLSSQTSQLVPDFVVDRHPMFAQFLEYYFEYIEEEIGDTDNLRPFDIISNLVPYNDIDRTYFGFLDFFRSRYAREFPYIGKYDSTDQRISTEIRRLLKNIREFYNAKGTVDSFEFFFRAIFNETIDVYFPKVDMLRASDGKWLQPYYIRVTNLDDTAISLEQESRIKNTFVQGLNSNAQAYLTEIVNRLPYNAAENTGIEIRFYLISDRVGDFEEGEEVRFTDPNDGTIREVLKIRESNTPSNAIYLGAWDDTTGTIYRPNDVFYVSSDDTPTAANEGYWIMLSQQIVGIGEDFDAFLTRIGDGVAIEKTSVNHPNYTPEDVGVETRFPGFWINEDGQLSSIKKLQDSFYYQDFSYEIRVNLDRSVYESSMLQNVHPSGFKFFNVVVDPGGADLFDNQIELLPPETYNRVEIEFFEDPFITDGSLYGPNSLDRNIVILRRVTNNAMFATDWTYFEYNLNEYDSVQISNLENETFESFAQNSGANHSLLFVNGFKVPVEGRKTILAS